MKEVLGYNGWIIAVIAVMILTIVFTYGLTKIGGNLPLIDSFTTAMSIIAMFLLMKRYREQWLFWIGVNISSIVMWLLVFTQNPVLNQDAIGMMLMWVVFLINSIVGFYRWYFMD